MRRTAVLAALALAAACAPQQRPLKPGPITATGVGVLTNTIRGRCTTIVAGDTLRRVCVPRGRAQGDSARVDTTTTRAVER
jgi:hypothetical protein